MATFHDVRLPEDIEQGAQGGPGFKTTIIELSSGVEQRVSNWSQARAKWNAGYGIQTPEEFGPVESFFYERGGRLHSFRFKDFHDFNCTNELIGVGDGSTRTFLFYRNYGAYARRITRPVTGTVQIFVDGVLKDPSTYDLTIAGGYVRFHVGQAPANTKEVRLTCEFDVPVRFDVDDLVLTLYWVRAGEIPQLPIVEVRDIVNAAPTIALANQVSTIADSTSTAARVFVADVVVTDDPFGSDTLSLTGADAAFYELVGTLNVDGGGVALYLKAGTVLDGAIKASYAVNVVVTDTTTSVTASVSHTLAVTAASRAPKVALSGLNASFPWNQSVATHIKVATITVTQAGSPVTGTNTLTLTGANAASFTAGPPTVGTGGYTSDLWINAGVTTPVDSNPANAVHYDVTVNVSNGAFASPPQDSKSMTVTFGVGVGTFIDNTPGTRGYVVPEYQTLVIDLWGGGAGASGYNAVGNNGGDSSITAMSLTAGGGKVSSLVVGSAGDFNTEGGLGGTATGGDVTQNGNPGGVGFFKKQPTSSAVTSGAGGASPSGGAGGAGVNSTAPATPSPLSQPAPPADPSPHSNHVSGNPGVAPGGGGSGSSSMEYRLVLTLSLGYTWTLYAQARPGAGSGAHVRKTFVRGVTPGAPVVGSTITYTVGAKGNRGFDVADGGDGANGRLSFAVS